MSVAVLESIVSNVKKRIEEDKKICPQNELIKRISKRVPRFFETLKQKNRTHIIAEIKYASPSMGKIKDFVPPEEVAAEYLGAGASALSILTERDHFHGSYEYLERVRMQFPEAVLLMKDFIVDEYQIIKANTLKADAILLIAALFSKEKLKEMLELTHSYGLDALVEVHSGEELQNALFANARIIGVNNRNLKTMSVDLATSIQLAAKLPKKDIILVSESGIKTNEDIATLKSSSYNCFLIGTSFMKEGSPGENLKKLTLPLVKICGITRFEDAKSALDAGAWSIGFVFYKESSRNISLKNAKSIALQLPTNTNIVGVFVDETLDTIKHIINEIPLSHVQLHGDEDALFCQKLHEECPQIKIIKAIDIGTKQEADYALSFPSFVTILMDAPTKADGQRGGTGNTADWEIACGIADKRPLILAGGLNSENIKKAFDTVHPFALDLCSGVEASKGVKDHGKIKALFESLIDTKR